MNKIIYIITADDLHGGKRPIGVYDNEKLFKRDWAKVKDKGTATAFDYTRMELNKSFTLST